MKFLKFGIITISILICCRLLAEADTKTRTKPQIKIVEQTKTTVEWMNPLFFKLGSKGQDNSMLMAWAALHVTNKTGKTVQLRFKKEAILDDHGIDPNTAVFYASAPSKQQWVIAATSLESTADGFINLSDKGDIWIVLHARRPVDTGELKDQVQAQLDLAYLNDAVPKHVGTLQAGTSVDHEDSCAWDPKEISVSYYEIPVPSTKHTTLYNVSKSKLPQYRLKLDTPDVAAEALKQDTPDGAGAL